MRRQFYFLTFSLLRLTILSDGFPKWDPIWHTSTAGNTGIVKHVIQPISQSFFLFKRYRFANNLCDIAWWKYDDGYCNSILFLYYSCIQMVNVHRTNRIDDCYPLCHFFPLNVYCKQFTTSNVIHDDYSRFDDRYQFIVSEHAAKYLPYVRPSLKRGITLHLLLTASTFIVYKK